MSRTRTHVTARGVKIPVAAILAAIKAGAGAARESSSDNRDESSPGGAKVTAGEVAEDVAAFLAAVAAEALPAILAANGVKV